ncbi:RNA polymerase II-associated factor 1 homolog [Drosophila kikkawai]|uniref:RNA polymerase II-associated factor 1 homolog n=1 Tax=Drosophila kikkawai TaxID=30033 RepID=A0ABM4GPQ2_DROKI
MTDKSQPRAELINQAAAKAKEHSGPKEQEEKKQEVEKEKSKSKAVQKKNSITGSTKGRNNNKGSCRVVHEEQEDEEEEEAFGKANDQHTFRAARKEEKEKNREKDRQGGSESDGEGGVRPSSTDKGQPYGSEREGNIVLASSTTFGDPEKRGQQPLRCTCMCAF